MNEDSVSTRVPEASHEVDSLEEHQEAEWPVGMFCQSISLCECLRLENKIVRSQRKVRVARAIPATYDLSQHK